jgi:hypothetical protein
MSKPTGEDETSLLRILGAIRVASLLLLLLHFYLFAGSRPEPTEPVFKRLTGTLAQTPVAGEFVAGKLLAFVLLCISLLGAAGRKSPGYTIGRGLTWSIAGIALFFGSGLFAGAGPFYVVLCSGGWLVLLHAGNYLSRIIHHNAEEDIFNRRHESFPQEQRLLQNARSVNLPARYRYNNRLLPSWINFVSPQRGTMILGSSGSGKTAYVLVHFIRQMIQLGHYSMVLHDFKYDDLTRLAFNCFRQSRSLYPTGAGFYNIQFDDLDHSHRCNLLNPLTLTDIKDAEESARALLLGLNMDWISKQGDFFVESAMALVTALIWYLRVYKNGLFCSWPHVIELAQTPRNNLFTLLRAEPQIKALIHPFVEALTDASSDQLNGQMATTLIGLARLSSPRVYYILTGNDFTLDVNDPAAPKIVTLGNNPQKAATYGPLVSAYLNAINRLSNHKGAHPLALIMEEFSTISVHTIDKTIATGRSNDIAVVLCLQNMSQLRLSYGDRFADVILNTCANVISGQVTGDTARLLSERFGRTLQDRQSLTANYSEVQITDSHQLEPVIPESRIAGLSPGEFVGMVADTPEQPISLKTFCCWIDVDFAALNAEENAFEALPVVRRVTEKEINDNFLRVRADIAALVVAEMKRIEDSPDLRHLVIS